MDMYSLYFRPEALLYDCSPTPHISLQWDTVLNAKHPVLDTWKLKESSEFLVYSQQRQWLSQVILVGTVQTGYWVFKDRRGQLIEGFTSQLVFDVCTNQAITYKCYFCPSLAFNLFTF